MQRFGMNIKRNFSKSVGISSYDAVVIGSGIGGMSATLGIVCDGLGNDFKKIDTPNLTSLTSVTNKKRVLSLEAESSHQYHSTGRSAAIFCEVYGSPPVRILSTATKPYFYDPKIGLAKTLENGSPDNNDLIFRRPNIWCSTKSSETEMRKIMDETKHIVPSLRYLSLEEIHELLPWTKPPATPPEELDTDTRELLETSFGKWDDDWIVSGGFIEPYAADMDVDAIWNSMRRIAMANGAEFPLSSRLISCKKIIGGGLELEVMFGEELRVIHTDIVVNAAGAWCDQVAEILGEKKMGIIPKQRTIIQFSPNDVSQAFKDSIPNYEQVQHSWPTMFDIPDRYYYKPQSGSILASPCDKVPTTPHDCVPDELAQALCIDRLSRSSQFTPSHITTSWAGLRCFVDDKEFVIGPSKNDGMWYLCGLGGYGIQTAMGNARLLSGLYHNKKTPQDLLDVGFDPAIVSPNRF